MQHHIATPRQSARRQRCGHQGNRRAGHSTLLRPCVAHLLARPGSRHRRARYPTPQPGQKRVLARSGKKAAFAGSYSRANSWGGSCQGRRFRAQLTVPGYRPKWAIKTCWARVPSAKRAKNWPRKIGTLLCNVHLLAAISAGSMGRAFDSAKKLGMHAMPLAGWASGRLRDRKIELPSRSCRHQSGVSQH